MLWTIAILLILAAFLVGILIGAYANIENLNKRLDKLEDHVYGAETVLGELEHIFNEYED